MSNYTILSFYITLTSIILFPSDIISTCLCLINIINNLSIAGTSENSSNICIFFWCEVINLMSKIGYLNRVKIFHICK